MNTNSKQRIATNSGDRKTTLRVNGVVVGVYTGEVRVELEADFNAVVGTSFTLLGNVNGNVTGTNITCGNIDGDLTGTNVTCKSVSGKCR